MPGPGGDGDVEATRGGRAPREVRLLADAGRIGAALLLLTLLVDFVWFDDPARPEEVRWGPVVPARPTEAGTTPASGSSPSPSPSPSDVKNCLAEVPPGFPTSPPTGYPSDRPWPPFSLCPDGPP